MLDDDVYDAARLRSDPEYDGVFFIAVLTTKIYCRPICPAKSSLRKNIIFLPSAAACEEGGYRPCLRCRPGKCTIFTGVERHKDNSRAGA